jgi:hypothetical protein
VKTAASTATVKATAATVTASAMLGESSTRNADESDRKERREKKL